MPSDIVNITRQDEDLNRLAETKELEVTQILYKLI